MARRSKRNWDDEYELNLAPIMNVVMILIPLLLISSSFVMVATLKVHSPRNAQSVNEEPVEEESEEVPVPRVVVAISDEGFTISDLRQSPAFIASELGNPRGDCAATASDQPVTICTKSDNIGSSLASRLNYRELYNRLIEIRRYTGTPENPGWAAQWDESNVIINILADREVHVDAVIRLMDVARYILNQESYGDDESFQMADYIEAGECTQNRDCELGVCASGACLTNLFPDPVLLLPNATE